MTDNPALLRALRAKYGEVRQHRSTKADRHAEYHILCPFCDTLYQLSPDQNFHLGIHSITGMMHCYRCGHKGWVSDLIGEMPMVAANLIPMPVWPSPKNKQPRRLILPYDEQQGGGLVSVDELPEDHPAVQYLLHRRARPFVPKIIARELGYTDDKGVCHSGVLYCEHGRSFMQGKYNTSDTLIFPIYEKVDGVVQPISWQSRMLYDPKKLSDEECEMMGFKKHPDKPGYMRPPKYFTAPSFDKSAHLINMVNARRQPMVVLTEGFFKVAAVGPSAVATLGKEISETQASLLKAYWEEVVVLLDEDADGRKTDALVADLRTAVPTVHIKLRGAGADDRSREELWKIISDERARQLHRPTMTFGASRN